MFEKTECLIPHSLIISSLLQNFRSIQEDAPLKIESIYGLTEYTLAWSYGYSKTFPSEK